MRRRKRGESRLRGFEIALAVTGERLPVLRKLRGDRGIRCWTERLVDLDRSRLADDAHAVDLAPGEIRHGARGALPDDDADAIFLRETFEPRREVDRVAEH